MHADLFWVRVFCSDLTLCGWSHHSDNTDISEDKAAHCYSIAERRQQVSVDQQDK